MRKVDFNEIIDMGLKADLPVSDTLQLASLIGMLKGVETGLFNGYRKLMNRGFVTFDGEEECYVPTKEGLRVFRKMKRETGTLANKLRQMYPPGMKDDKWPWRGTPKTIMDKLDEFFKDYPDVTDEEIVKAAQDYLSKFQTDAGRSLLAYFISKLVDGEKRSILAEYVYANREGKEVKVKSSYDQL